MTKFSIIIPCKTANEYLQECLGKIKEQSFTNYEIIVLPDKKEIIKGARVIPLKAGPAEKRDLGVKKAKGNIIAFIDDDAFPDKDWLKNSLKYFKGRVAAVGGPQITPPGDSFSRKLSGFVLSSFLVGGLRARYEKVNKSFFVDDWPTVNFLIKKDVFQKIGGFDSIYYPGEDTKLCLDLIKNNYKIIYAPDVVVYHHRRKGVRNYLKQISNYGLHRGYFVRKFPETSFKLTYFMPSLFLLMFVSGIALSFFNSLIRNLFLISMLVYLMIGFAEGLRLSHKISYSAAMPFYLLLTHLFYGANFIKGLFSKRLVR